MYRVVNLPRKVLITTDEVIAQGPTDETPSPRLLLSAIQIAEERFVKPVLGSALYLDFRDKKNVVVTDVNKDFLETTINEELNLSETLTLEVGDIVNAIELVDDDWYVELWNEYVWKICAEAVVYTAIPTNFTRFTAQGEMQNNPRTMAFNGEGAGSASAELKDVKFIMDKTLMDRIDPLLAAMKEWICDNITHFPLYDSKKCKCKTDGISVERKTGWVHGIYKDRRRNWRDE